jgi:hypothetical protein
MPPVLLPVIIGPGPANSEPKAEAGVVGAAANKPAASASDTITKGFRIIATPPPRLRAPAFRARLACRLGTARLR